MLESNMTGNNGNGVTMRDVSRVIKEQNIKFIDLKFVDLPGILQHLTLPVEVYDEKIFIEGSLRGVLATVTPEEANARRLEIAEKVAQQASTDLRKLGLVLDFVKIQNLSDDQGYVGGGDQSSRATRQSGGRHCARGRRAAPGNRTGGIEPQALRSRYRRSCRSREAGHGVKSPWTSRKNFRERQGDGRSDPAHARTMAKRQHARAFPHSDV